MIALKIILISVAILISFTSANRACTKFETTGPHEKIMEKPKTQRSIAFRVLGLMKTKSGAT